MSKTANCGMCGRPLTDPESVAAGIGPVCRGSRSINMLEVRRRNDRADWFDGSIPLHKELHLKRHADGGLVTNVPLTVVNHSPTGFEVGSAGSGPADLALNLAVYFVNRLGIEMRDWAGNTHVEIGSCKKVPFPAAAIYQDLKFQLIARLDPLDDPGAWLRVDGDRIAQGIQDLVEDFRKKHAGELFE